MNSLGPCGNDVFSIFASVSQIKNLNQTAIKVMLPRIAALTPSGATTLEAPATKLSLTTFAAGLLPFSALFPPPVPSTVHRQKSPPPALFVPKPLARFPT